VYIYRYEIDKEIRRQNPGSNPYAPNTPSNGVQSIFYGKNMPASGLDRDDWVIISPYRIEFTGSTEEEDLEDSQVSDPKAQATD
jgi:hypothetical protein